MTMTPLTQEECRQLLSNYNTALTSRIDGHRSKNLAKDLLELDSWRLNDLSNAVRKRNPSFMSKVELEKLMDCKLSRGTFRPRLKQLISSNPAEEVASTTKKAFLELANPTKIPSILTAVKTLSELKGVGPATATMILQAKSDDIPFMSDEAMLQVFDGDKTKLKYDVKTCGTFIDKVYEIGNRLAKEFSPAELERVLYTKEIIGLNTSSKRASDAISPLSTESKRKKSTTDNKSKTVVRKVESKDKSTPRNSSTRSSSQTKPNSAVMKLESSSESTNVSSADKAIGVPRVGIGIIVLNKEDQVLIGKRKSPHGQGTWSLPGGHLEFFEAFESCARREVLEETNLVLANDLKFVSTENNFFPNNTPQRHYVTVCLSAHVVDESELENMEPDKCEGWEWVTANDLLDDNGGYRPLFVPLKHMFIKLGLVKD